ncbi:hypothetical protein MTO96_028747 [Rhipicephalus appendiculatus]
MHFIRRQQFGRTSTLKITIHRCPNSPQAATTATRLTSILRGWTYLMRIPTACAAALPRIKIPGAPDVVSAYLKTEHSEAVTI